MKRTSHESTKDPNRFQSFDVTKKNIDPIFKCLLEIIGKGQHAVLVVSNSDYSESVAIGSVCCAAHCKLMIDKSFDETSFPDSFRVFNSDTGESSLAKDLEDN
jgi:hypothetical protein